MMTRIYIRIIIGFTLTTALLTVSSAQDLESGPDDEPLRIQRIKSPIELDGFSNEAAWEDIRSLPMIMKVPSFGSEPSEHTEFLLGYDDDYLYAAGRFYDREPDKIQSNII